jgi:radical SAM superfamily enzyme YgiQ (UPF0313 family)
MKVSLVFIRDRRFFSRPSSKFLARRKKNPYAGDKKHYVFGEPPMGIMYLSTILKQDGHEVSLTDQCHPEYSDEKFIESLSKERPEIIGISFLSNMCYPAARSLSQKIKAACPAAKIVYGGVFPTINAQKIIACENSVDIVARGEGEGIIRELTDGHTKLSDIAGITFRSDSGKIIATPDREGIRNLDTIPFPDRDSLDINYVASLPLDVPAVIWDIPYTTMVSSRGCPFACTYCNCPTFSHRQCRYRSVANVMKELDEIAKLGYGSFCFLDDNFLLDVERAKEICKGINEHGLTFRWACEGRAETKANGVFQELAKAGCDVVMFGIESGSQRVLNSMNKKTKIPEIEAAVATAKKAGIGIIHGFFIVGAPGETIEEVQETFRFAEKIEINSFAFNSLTAFRGTTLWDDAVSKGLIDEEKDWDKMFPVHMIYPDAIPSKTLFKLRAGLVKQLILRKILLHPLQAAKIFARFLKCMSLGDLYRLLTSSKSTAKPAVK